MSNMLRDMNETELLGVRETVDKLLAEMKRDKEIRYQSKMQPDSGDRGGVGAFADLDHLFTYHDDATAVPRYVAIRSAAKHFAEVVLQNTPVCSDQTVALRTIREAVMWANAAVALQGRM